MALSIVMFAILGSMIVVVIATEICVKPEFTKMAVPEEKTNETQGAGTPDGTAVP